MCSATYYGCPAEEGGFGKSFMAREGVFEDLDFALCWHPAPAVGLDSLASARGRSDSEGSAAARGPQAVEENRHGAVAELSVPPACSAVRTAPTSNAITSGTPTSSRAVPASRSSLAARFTAASSTILKQRWCRPGA